MIEDRWGARPVERRVEHFRGPIVAMRTDAVQFEGGTHDRDYVVHMGAVAIVAMDDDDRLLVIQQYRHPVAAHLWEIPAGLLDKPGEEPWTAAQRELAEEAGYLATDWSLLVDYATTPGGSTELLRIYLARDLRQLAERPSTGEAEEQDMPVDFVALDAVCDAIFAGRVASTSLVVGALAAREAAQRGWADLRPADSPWPFRAHLADAERVFRR